MSFVALEGFTPPPRYDNLPWTQQRMEYGADSPDGPWAAVETQNLIPVDPDPTDPASRNMSSTIAPSDTGWFRIVFVDAGGHEIASGAVFVNPGLFAPLGRTMGELCDELVQIAGLDVENDTGLAWLNNAHAIMVARSRCVKQTLQLSATDGTSSVGAPGVVELYAVTIDGQEYTKVSRSTMRNLQAGHATISWPGLAFSSEADDGGNATFEVFPTPDAGLAVEVYAAVYPPNLGRGDRPMVPRTHEKPLIEGAFATGLAFDTEQINAADRFEARFDAACEELRRTVKRQFRGPGPTQILVRGVNG